MQRFVFIFCVVLSLQSCNSPAEEINGTKTPQEPLPDYVLVWSDDFSGSAINTALWNYETGTGVNGDFGTGQLDRATDRTANISIVHNIEGADGGCLAVTTRKERFIDRDYTSGRINTRDKGFWGPGHRIEARIRAADVLAKGQGFAFWMMPQEKPEGTNFIMWPQGGEIDIMEYVGSVPYHNLGSVHYAWSWNNNEWADWNHGHKGAYYSYAAREVPVQNPTYSSVPVKQNDTAAGSGQFHIYGIEWFSDRMEFYVDGTTYHIHYFTDGAAFDRGVKDGQDKTGIVVKNGKRIFLSEYSDHFDEWKPFAHPFYIILSAGVGGSDTKTYGGAIIPDALFPCSVYVDWVRVYKNNNFTNN